LKAGKIKDITGQRFGKITVIRKGDRIIYPSGDSKISWICICDCGNEVITTGSSLRVGNTTSCGKCRFVNRLGEVFGKLTVISKVENTRNTAGHVVTTWKCQCSCGNRCDISAGNLVAGNVKSCGCLFNDVQAADLLKRKESFLKTALEIHKNIYKYDLSNFINSSSTITIECPKHGIFFQAVRDHVFGCGCQKCAKEKRSVGTEEFIKRSIEIHGSFYDYSLVEYVNNSSKVKIICPEHGLFEQLPASHMNGNSCWECAANKRHWNYKAYCESNPDFGSRAGNVYLLKLSNEEESFLKVGVSIGILNRFAKYRKDGFIIDVLFVYETTAFKSSVIEIDVLKFIKDNNFKIMPKTDFSGRTECADLAYESQLLEYFKGLS